MLRRTIYFLLVIVLLGGIGGAIGFYAFDFKPKFLAQIILGSPRPPETVSAEPAREEGWEPRISALGTLTAVNGIDVAPQVGGIVRELFFDSGADVRKGDKLAQLNTETEQADLKNLKVQLETAQSGLNRRSAVFKKGYAPKAELEEAQSRRDQLEAGIQRIEALIAQKTIHAPWDGRLGLRTVDVGAYVAAGTPIVWLQSIDPIQVDFPVTEEQFGRIEIGQPVEAVMAAYPSERFKGKIVTIDARMSDASRTVTIRAELDNPQGKLLPGMYADVTVTTGGPQPFVTVSQTSITYTLYGDSVFVAVAAKDAGAADKPLEIEKRIVTLGETRGERVAVTSGLKAGEQVVTAGHNKIDQGSKVVIDNSIALQLPENRSTN